MAIRNLSTEGLFHVRVAATRFARTHRSHVHGGRGVGLRVQYAAADVHAARAAAYVHTRGYVYTARAIADAYTRGYVYATSATANAYARGYVYTARTIAYVHARGYIHAARTTANAYARGYVYTAADIYAGSNSNAYPLPKPNADAVRRHA